MANARSSSLAPVRAFAAAAPPFSPAPAHFSVSLAPAAKESVKRGFPAGKSRAPQ